MRRELTPAELALWQVLRNAQLGHLKFRRQVPLGAYIADFVCFDPRIVVECDGGQHADNTYDDTRDAWFRAEGFTVLRFWNNEIDENVEAITDAILRVAKPPPQPSSP
jgi:very-short-patch-repair endonuclease